MGVYKFVFPFDCGFKAGTYHIQAINKSEAEKILIAQIHQKAPETKMRLIICIPHKNYMLVGCGA
ncbi:hypothetical protein FACS1894166_11130 [Bacilli bacterium]|nr:hypothetical protein FACS1894166_11130 [Bacilli bacterium]